MVKSGMRSRRHHFVPRFLLGAFTDTGEPNGFLFVHDLKGRRRRAWRVRPLRVAHERDYYRVEIPGHDPGLAEDALGKIESAAAPIIRRIREIDALPPYDDFGVLLDFVATLAARVPKRRAIVPRFLSDLARMTLEIVTATPERYAAQIRRLREEGKDVPDVSFEKMRDFVRKDAQFEVDPTWNVANMFEQAQIIRTVLSWRTWSLLRAKSDAPNFICSDNPVCILPSKPEGAGPFGSVGWGMPDTFVLVPLYRRGALYGTLAALPPPGSAETRRMEDAIAVSMRTVATLNCATLASAERHVYSALEDFIWMKRDGTVGHVSDLPDLAEALDP